MSGASTHGSCCNKSIQDCLTWLIALGAVLTYYGHALIPINTPILPPLIIGTTLFFVVLSGCLGFLSLTYVPVARGLRLYSYMFLFMSLWLGVISSISGLFYRHNSASDWGIFIIELALPIFIMLIKSRTNLFLRICQTCVVFAAGDLIVNLGTFLGFNYFNKNTSGENSEYGIHYLGIPGNSFAEGIVAFVAVSYLTAIFVEKKSFYSRSFLVLAIVALMASEWMIRARTDFLMSTVSIFLLAHKKSYKVPLILVLLVMSSILLWGSFYDNPYNTNESLRVDLLLDGAQRALRFPMLGEGAHFRSTSELTANYFRLRDAGITESGTLDHAIAYGIPSIMAFYISVFLVLSAGRNHQTLPVVIVVCMTGSMVLTGSIDSLFGALIFYLSLAICQREETLFSRLIPSYGRASI